jgi:hypothetical protein
VGGGCGIAGLCAGEVSTALQGQQGQDTIAEPGLLSPFHSFPELCRPGFASPTALKTYVRYLLGTRPLVESVMIYIMDIIVIFLSTYTLTSAAFRNLFMTAAAMSSPAVSSIPST